VALREAMLVAIDELGEAISSRCTTLLREHGGSTADLRQTVAELSGLLQALETVDYSGSR
jgi:hypothetical protein